MGWRKLTEQAVLGSLEYGILAFLFSQNLLTVLWAAPAGALVHGGFAFLRPLPWRRYFLHATQQACVSVHPKTLSFGEISRASPEKYGFIRFHDLDKRELFKRLDGKRLDPATIPFHMKRILEERRELQTSWAAVEPYLRPQ